jgi:hypothetical protein
MMITLLYYYMYTMKNSVKAFAFVAAALGLTVLSLQGTNAQSNATVDLVINSGAIVCSNGNFNLGTFNTSFSTQLTPDTASTTGWQCIDLQGINGAAVQVIMWTPISNGITTILGSDTEIRVQSGSAVHNCAGGVTFQSTYADLGTAPVDLMTKNTASSICTYSSLPELRVTIPAQATQGNYSGVISVTFPS